LLVVAVEALNTAVAVVLVDIDLLLLENLLVEGPPQKVQYLLVYRLITQ
jgi:hypothetical protein